MGLKSVVADFFNRARRVWQSGEFTSEKVPGWARPVVNLVSPYHRTFSRKFPARQSSLSSSIRVIGYIACPNGVGELARGAVNALRAVRYPTDYAEITCQERVPPEEVPARDESVPAPGVNLVFVNASNTRSTARRFGLKLFRNRLNIGYWSWEFSKFPVDWYAEFGLYDEIWTLSKFCQSAIGEIAPVPVLRMRPVVEPLLAAPPSRAALGLPEDRFIFYFSLNVLSVIERKNPLGLIDAYRRAFGASAKDTCLVLKLSGTEIMRERAAEKGLDVQELETVAERLAEVGGILIDGQLPRSQVNGLLAACDCYVSLHRCEGFGLSIAEAMFFGKPTIATAYSGNMDFMSPSNSYGIGYRLVELDKAHGEYYAAGNVWAEPDLDQAAQAMQEVYRDRDKAHAMGVIGAQDIRRDYSAQAVGRAMAERIGLASLR